MQVAQEVQSAVKESIQTMTGVAVARVPGYGDVIFGMDANQNVTEIMTVVDDYYAAANANTGIVWKGAYRETTNITALDFVAGRDETPITGLDVDRSLNTVVIKVRVTGVNAIGGGVADSSNPKTGDSIYTAMVVMGISAASLAAVMYFYNKKRMAI